MDGRTKAQVERPPGPKSGKISRAPGSRTEDTGAEQPHGRSGPILERRRTDPQAWLLRPQASGVRTAKFLPAAGDGLLVSVLIMLVLSTWRTEPKGKAS